MTAAPRPAGPWRVLCLGRQECGGRELPHSVDASSGTTRAATLRATRAPLLTAVLALLAIVASLPALAPALELTRQGFAAGEVWRALTGHFTHWTRAHFVWDWLAFVALGGALEARGRRRLAALLLTSAIAIAGTFLLFEPALHTYRGLSGLASALFGLAWILALRRSATQSGWRGPRTLLIAACGVGFVTKLAWELRTQSAFFMPANSPFVPVPLAHAIGAALGSAFGLGGDELRASSARRERA